MAFNKDKALKEAEKLSAKGKDRDAIALLKEVVKNDPRDLNTLNKLGDLQQKVGDKAAAIESFALVADKYASDGFNLRAIAMLKKCQRVDPARIEFVEKLADLNAQQGLINEAKLNFTQVAEHYLKEGKADRARQVYARIAEIEPDNLKNRLKLADLYLKENKVREALGEYQVIGSELAKKGMLEESLQVLEKALGLDPSNMQILRALAKTRVDAGRAEEAVQFVRSRLEQKGGNDPDLLLVLGETFQAARAFEPARQCLDRAIQVAPQRGDVRQALFRLSLDIGDADAALAHYEPLAQALVAAGRAQQAIDDLKLILRVREGHVGALERLLQLHVDTGADQKSQADWMSRLADAYIAQGRNAEAERVLARLAALEPDVSQHAEKLEFVRLKLRPAGGAAAPAPPMAAQASQGFGFGGAASGPPAGDESFGGLSLSEPESSSFAMSFDDDDYEAGGRGDDRAEFIAERTAEADVFVKYGLVDKAIEQLTSIIARHPDDLPTRQRLASLLADEGKQSEAVEQLVAIAQAHRQAGNAAGEQEAVASARRIAPSHPALARFAPAAEPAPPPSTPAFGGFSFGGDEEPTPSAPPARAPEPVTGGFELSLDDEPAAARFDFGAPASPAARPVPPPAAPAGDEFEISLDAGDDEQADEPEVSLDADDESGFAFGTPQAPAPPAPQPPPAAPSGDAEFEISMDDEPEGLAPAPPAAAPTATPEDDAFEISVDEPEMEVAFDEPAAPEPAVAAPAPEPPAAAESDEGLFGAEDDFFNFADELNKEMESDGLTQVSRGDDHSMTLEQIVSGIQAGVAAQVDREDYETHYNLGIAYKEMGLQDEAIAEFQYASKDASKFLQCCILLGACFTEKGMPELSVTWYEKGKTAPGLTEDDRLALDYEIALCHEAIGEEDKALKGFLGIYAQNARYRDVAQRVARLKQASGR